MKLSQKGGINTSCKKLAYPVYQVDKWHKNQVVWMKQGFPVTDIICVPLTVTGKLLGTENQQYQKSDKTRQSITVFINYADYPFHRQEINEIKISALMYC